jgi:hypothetical protein
MNEQDVRQRIASFLKRTAREVVMPASMCLSLALSGPSFLLHEQAVCAIH